MSDPQTTPTDPRPDQAAPTQQPAPAADAAPETTSTQEHLGDGTGVRGGYGDASQTNGAEGTPDQPQTDTELTGS